MPIFADDLDPEQLPPIIAQIAAAIGIEPTEALINRYAGGRPLYVPIRVTGHQITEVIGEEAARLLAQDWGGTSIYIPKCSITLRSRRDSQVMNLRTVRKWKIAQIARASGITRSSVYRILRKNHAK